MEQATTRQLVICLVAVSIGLMAVSIGGCSSSDRTAYSRAEWHLYTKDQDRWSGGGSP